MLRARIALGFFALFAISLSAQTLTFNATAALTQGANGGISGTGTGTVSPGGAASFTLAVLSTDNDNCSNVAQLDFAVTLTGGDKINFRAFIPGTDENSGPIALNGTFVVTSGTGQFAGKGGSGNTAVVVNFSTASATIALTGSLSSQYVPTASIRPGGVVPVYSASPKLQPGSWVSVYGDNLANATTEWDGKFPTSLGGVTATVNGKAAYLWFVSAGQINMQVPDDSVRGCVDVKVNTPNGSATTKVELVNQGPSLSLLDAKYPAAVILTPNGSGAYGAGSYDLAGSAGRYSFATRKVKKGETLVLYGVGFGPTTPAVPAGQEYRGGAPVTSQTIVVVNFGGITFRPPFIGVVGAGLYQINLTVPTNIPSGDTRLQVNINGSSTQNDIFVTIE